jgi:hypothetical protein
MPAAKLNLTLREGATFRTRLTLKDARKRSINLTGATLRIEFRDRKDGVLLYELTAGNGRLTVTPTLGRVDILLTAAETEALTFAKAVWDLRIEMAGGDVIYPVEGNILVQRSVTE